MDQQASPPFTEHKSSNLLWIYPLVLVLSLALLAAGLYLAGTGRGWTMAAAGSVGLIGVLIGWPIAHNLSGHGGIVTAVKGTLDPVYERLEQFSVMLNEISDQQLLSEQAKSVAYREKDREALRRAIQEDLVKRDWEAALVLVDEMDNRFGYKSEAERIRGEINQKFADHIRRQVQAGIVLIERHASNQQWAAALREADRLQQQFPTDDQVEHLPSRIEQQRLAYKDRLLNEYNDLVAKKDIDGAILTVRKLDFYLTSTEAGGMQDSVRTLFKDKLNQLKDQFTDSVHQSRWSDAHNVGELIVRDFPNTQMAREVREKLDSLKQRADEGRPAAATA